MTSRHNGSIILHLFAWPLQGGEAILQRALFCVSFIPYAVINRLKCYRGFCCLCRDSKSRALYMRVQARPCGPKWHGTTLKRPRTCSHFVTDLAGQQRHPVPTHCRCAWHGVHVVCATPNQQLLVMLLNCRLGRPRLGSVAKFLHNRGPSRSALIDCSQNLDQLRCCT